MWPVSRSQAEIPWKKKTAVWLRAVRLPTLTASFIPVALGGLLGQKAHAFNALPFILAVLAMTFFQVTSNLINDVDDYRNKVDTKDSLGSSRVIVDALLTQRQMMTAAWVFFGTAVAVGIYLAATAGYVIAVMGVIGAAGAYFYTRKPFCFKYRGYGIPLVFLMFGPLPVMGSYYLFCHSLSLESGLLSIPVGLLTTAILQANDLRDIDYDAKAGVRTFSMALGVKNARRFYIGLIAASFLSVPLLILCGVLSCWGFLVFLSAPLAYLLIRSADTPALMRSLDHRTAGLQMTFGALLLVAVLL